MASTSLPPLDADILNSSAEPTAGSVMANSSSSIGWSVSGAFIGQSQSNASSRTESSRLA